MGLMVRKGQPDASPGRLIHNTQEAREAMLDPLFVAALLEGFEGTLDEVVGRVEDRDLRVRLDVLQSQ